MAELKIERVVTANFWNNMEKQITDLENAMCAMELVWHSIKEDENREISNCNALRSMMDYFNHLVYFMRDEVDGTKPFKAARIAEATA